MVKYSLVYNKANPFCIVSTVLLHTDESETWYVYNECMEYNQLVRECQYTFL